MSEINDWDIAAANNNDVPPDGWPENTMQYSEVNNTGREGMAVLARYFQDSNGALSTGGIADAYTLTLNAGHVAYFAGMYIAATFNATNTGATTIDVNGIGVQDIVDRGGNPLSAGEIQSGGIYELRHDGTEFQLMGSIVGMPTVVSAIFTNSNTPDLVDTDVAINVGAVDPDSAQHIEIGPQGIQSKSDDVTATNLRLQEAGGFAELWGDGNPRVVTAASNTHFRSNGNTDAEQRRILGTHQDGTVRWFIGHNGDVRMEVRNQIDSGTLILRGNNAASAVREFLEGDPDGGVTIGYPLQNVTRLETIASGGLALRSNLNTDTEQRAVIFQHQDGTERAIVGHITDDDFEIINRIHGGAIHIQAENLAGTLTQIMFADPEGNLTLYGNGVSGLGAWDRTGLANTTGGFVIDSVANVFPVGFNTLPGRTITASQTIDGDFIGRFWEKTSGGAATITCDNDAAIPNGGTIMIANIDTEVMSVNEGAGVTLQWLDGSGATVTGNRSVAGLGSVISIRKRNSTNFQIWGNGIS